MTSKEMHIYLASAGTGKTHTLMNIVEEHLQAGVDSKNIAFVTFTRAGAQVAQSRAAKRFDLPLQALPHFRTIHSMAFRGVGASRDQMMNYERYKKFGDMCEYDFGKLMLDVAEGVDWSKKTDAYLLAMEQLYRANKEYALSIMEDRVVFADLVEFMQRYKQFKDVNRYKDFTDLLEEYLDAQITENVDVVCLDEMQDSSPLQWKVVFQAFQNATKWYIAADQKQCIYSFAGADPTKILRLKGVQHRLNLSHRVPRKLLGFSEYIAGLLSVDDGVRCTTDKEGGELNYIVSLEELPDLTNTEESWLFLARNRAMFKKYEQWCKEHCVPYWEDKGNEFPSMSMKVKWKDGNLNGLSEEEIMYLGDYERTGTLYKEAKVRISTIHGVKGDEADNVALLSDISIRVKRGMEIDEDAEHRVFYVAVTRAKKRLYVVQPMTKTYYPYLF